MCSVYSILFERQREAVAMAMVMVVRSQWMFREKGVRDGWGNQPEAKKRTKENKEQKLLSKGAERGEIKENLFVFAFLLRGCVYINVSHFLWLKKICRFRYPLNKKLGVVCGMFTIWLAVKRISISHQCKWVVLFCQCTAATGLPTDRLRHLLKIQCVVWISLNMCAVCAVLFRTFPVQIVDILALNSLKLIYVSFPTQVNESNGKRK